MVPLDLPSLAAALWVVFPPFPETVDQDTVVIVVAAVDVPFQSPLSSPVGKGDLHQDHHTAATDAAVVAANVAPPGCGGDFPGPPAPLPGIPLPQ